MLLYNILLDTVKAANTSDGKTVAEKLHAMQFSTALGPITFNDKGNVAESPYVVWVTRNGNSLSTGSHRVPIHFFFRPVLGKIFFYLRELSAVALNEKRLC